MWSKISLRLRIYLLICAIISIAFIGGITTIWQTYVTDQRLTEIVNRDLAAYRAAVSLEIALVNQKGFVSYYFVDRDPEWLRQLGEARQEFVERLRDAAATAQNQLQIKAVARIETEYLSYIEGKDRVIGYYKRGETARGSPLHGRVRDHFFELLKLCETYRDMHGKKIEQIRGQMHQQMSRFRRVAAGAVAITLLLGVLLSYVLVKQLFGQLRDLAAETGQGRILRKPEDVIKSLRSGVRSLMEDIDHTHSQLKKSQVNLEQAEKMALVGKLAAGVAHSIRNPFTSIKMRLFSLNRTLKLTPEQQEDLAVISTEIRQVDNIIQNFLEFSRPPRLKVQRISPSTVVDQAIQLLKHRLKSYGVQVAVERRNALPELDADPEQLKEVLVNLIVNACEAMGTAGVITIEESVVAPRETLPEACIRISDTGPGIPAELIEKVMQPFFSTKETGTGLGLSIAARIIEEHGGRMELDSVAGRGTSVGILLPLEDLS